MEDVILERHGAVALLRINRPAARNALNRAVIDALGGHLLRMENEHDIRCIVITGDERAFSAGADLKEMAHVPATVMARRGASAIWRALDQLGTPVIAAVNGYALGGGCELAMGCDIIVAGEGARFGLPEIRSGILPGGGGTQRLLRAIGKHRAMLLLLTGDMLPAREAHAYGLVSQVVQDGRVVAEALALAARIAGMPPLAVHQIKEAVRHGQDAALPTALSLERNANYLLFASDDRREGMQAFAEKRPPVFTGS
ncbi:MAG: enoyl-CoA hydratase/isomerase family protein [Burkholderiales bacterium]|jgi:enoyl-CoA hydratase/carnithine racemase|nr:enoyl-CoA hydratase/isomerase family protein [Burkholderiales bacterium]